MDTKPELLVVEGLKNLFTDSPVSEFIAKINPAVIADAAAVIQDIIAISKTPEGKKLIADLIKLLSDFKSPGTEA